jgi:hypothetical protein
MSKSLLFSSWRRSLLLLLGFGLVLFLAPRGGAQSPSQDPKTAPTPSTNLSPAVNPSPAAAAPQTEAQKKAAERKKRFEEQKNLLDGGGGGSAGAGAAATPAATTDSEFYMNPIAVNMVANESQELHVWDRRGTGNDVSARVSWGLSNSGIVDMTANGYATITAKMPGTVNVTGRIDGHDVQAVVTVYRGEKLPWGVPRAVSAPPPVRTGGRRNTMTVIESPN